MTAAGLGLNPRPELSGCSGLDGGGDSAARMHWAVLPNPHQPSRGLTCVILTWRREALRVLDFSKRREV